MLYNYVKSINLMVPKFIEKSVISKEEVTIYTNAESVASLITFLKLRLRRQTRRQPWLGIAVVAKAAAEPRHCGVISSKHNQFALRVYFAWISS